jgi:RHS repeat-associated protein
MNSKHIFLGETRIATKGVYADGSFIQTAEKERQYYYHSDHLGSAQLITDWQGKEYERFEYTPYGEAWIEKASAVSALDVPYRFTGKERDKETGLYYYGARYLDPRESRWLSVDPAMGEYVPGPGQEAGKLPGMGDMFNTVNLHVYHYAGNNPVKYVDPDGKWDVKAGIGFGPAIKINIQYKNDKLTLGVKVGFGYGKEVIINLTDEEKEIGTRFFSSVEGDIELALGEAGALGINAQISKDTNGQIENKASISGTAPGSELKFEITVDDKEINADVSKSLEYGSSAMVFMGVGYESTVKINNE